MRVKEGKKELKIIDSAIKVFAEYGYHKAKIHKIADDAGVATGSVYLYFKNKNDILYKIFAEIWNNLLAEIKLLQEKEDLNAEEKIEYLINVVFDIFSPDPNLAKVFVNEQVHIIKENKIIKAQEDFFNIGERIIQEGIKQKTIDKNINVKIFRYFLLGGIRLLLDQWANDPESISINEMRKNVKQIVKKGILN